MPTTLSDIAHVLGISKMTVSRAINNHPEISRETRERILEVARKLNYKPNHYARALATKRSYLIGFIVPDLMHSFFAELAIAVEAIARPAGYEILICNTKEDTNTEIAEVEALRHRTDGLIIASALSPDQTKRYRKMIREGAKIVFVDRRLENLRCPEVTTDDVRVGMLATEHLIKLGHRRIGHLRGPAVALAANRFAGYLQALAKHKIRYVDTLIRNCGFLESEGYQVMRAWIASGTVPPAIFAVNDPAAIGAMQALEEAEMRVPEDVAIVGAGNIHYGDMLRVPLTSVSWSKTGMGQQAARLLIRMIEVEKDGSDKAKGQHIIIEPELIVRKSCGASNRASASRTA